MGAQQRVYRRKIRSVQATKKITKAMELIAASRIVTLVQIADLARQAWQEQAIADRDGREGERREIERRDVVEYRAQCAHAENSEQETDDRPDHDQPRGASFEQDVAGVDRRAQPAAILAQVGP